MLLSSCGEAEIWLSSVTTASVKQPADVLWEQEWTSEEFPQPWPSLSVQLARSRNKADSIS